MITWHTSHTDNSLVSELCYRSESDVRPAAVNMAPRNWQDNPNTLLYKLISEGMFDTGGYGIVTTDSGPVAGSGYHPSTWHPDIWIQGTRSYTLPGHHSNYTQGELWHTQCDLATERGAKILMVPFNRYNIKLRDQGVKLNDPDTYRQSFCEAGLWYRAPGRRIQPVKPLSHSVEYQHTEQWIFYHVLDWSWHREFLDICKNNQFGRIINENNR